MNAKNEAYTIKRARELITGIISKTMFGGVDRDAAIAYLTGQTSEEPIATWGFDDDWNQWGNPELDEAERFLLLENGYLLGLTDDERRKRIDAAAKQRREVQAEVTNREMDEIICIGRKEAAKAYQELNLKPIEDKLDAARKDHADIQADTTGTATKVANIGNGVGWLVGEEKRKQQKRAKNGKESQAKGNTEERKRAARDMETALNRLHDRMKNGANNLLAECREVCKYFLPLTSRKNALGKYEECAPLTRADGEAVKPETLARNYRTRFGTKRARKARAAKAKRRTK